MYRLHSSGQLVTAPGCHKPVTLNDQHNLDGLQDEITAELHHTGKAAGKRSQASFAFLPLTTIPLLSFMFSLHGAESHSEYASGAGILSMANAGPNTNGQPGARRHLLLGNFFRAHWVKIGQLHASDPTAGRQNICFCISAALD